MSKISDELREINDKLYMLATDYQYVDGADIRFVKICNRLVDGIFFLKKIIGRIDNEMIELPKDANDEYFHKGDIVYDKNGMEWTVKGISYNDWQPTDTNEYIPEVTIDVYRMDEDACFVGINNCSVKEYSHKRPDGLKSIANEMNLMNADHFNQGFMIVSHDKVAEWANRILKFANDDKQ